MDFIELADVPSSSAKGKEKMEDDEFSFVLAAANKASGRSVRNQLYNLLIQINIPGIKPFILQAILDTGATTCCVGKNAVPEEAIEDVGYSISYSGINSRQETSKKLKMGSMRIGEHTFRIPFTFILNMDVQDGVQMLIGCNFLRSMAGGLRIEGSTITFYKEITSVQTSQEIKVANMAIPELELEVEDYYDLASTPIMVMSTSAFTDRFSSLFKLKNAQRNM